MQTRFTLPIVSALVTAFSLASCQREAEEPVISPGAGRGQVWFEVSERPMGGETKAAPATIETFTTSHESFRVVGYTYASGSPSKDKVRDIMQVSYVSERDRWEPANPVGYSFAGNRLEFYAWYPLTTSMPYWAEAPDVLNDSNHPTITYMLPTNAEQQIDLMVAKASGVTDSPSTDEPVSLTFSHKLTAVKFSIGVGTTCTRIFLDGIPSTGTLDMVTDTWSVTGPISVAINDPAFGSADANGQCPIADEQTMMLLPQTLPEGATLTAYTSFGIITASLAGQVWEPGKAVTYKLTDPAASFSVSDTKRVGFSPGNLQAFVFAAAGDSFTWRFAENQWDYVGNAAANTSINDNGSVSASGMVDLFGWSTAATKNGIHNSTDNSTYSGDFVDWGSDSDLIAALGFGWRTLTSAEWVHLLNTRGGGAAGYPRYCKATVNGVAGLVIFPDDYVHPSGVTAPTSVNTGNAAYTSNSWSGAAWTVMEGVGCVFLPAAGYRDGTSVNNVGSFGGYWSSTPMGANYAYRLYFDSSGVYPADLSSRYLGRSVRLVKDL